MLVLLLALSIQDAGPREPLPRTAAAAAAAEAAGQAVEGWLVLPAHDEPPTCDRDGSMYEMKACAGDDLEREQERMRRYMEAAEARARDLDEASVRYGPQTRQAAWLSESQEAWRGYADSRCHGVLEATSGGTMGGLGYAWCMTDVTRRRTHDIWEDYLTYADSTPPILPEPVRTIAEERVAAGLD
jgi:uncharacterized protein YecT (DUF1311 family)